MYYLLPGILAMAAIVLASNILVQFLFGQWLTWGAFTYPLAFLVTDLVNFLHGPKAARKVVLAGFAVGLLCSLVGSQIVGEAGPLVTLRIALASGVAFLVAQLLDVALFDRLRQGTWWRAPLASTLVGQRSIPCCSSRSPFQPPCSGSSRATTWAGPMKFCRCSVSDPTFPCGSRWPAPTGA
jgi:queuosine precursor transporter